MFGLLNYQNQCYGWVSADEEEKSSRVPVMTNLRPLKHNDHSKTYRVTGLYLPALPPSHQGWTGVFTLGLLFPTCGVITE